MELFESFTSGLSSPVYTGEIQMTMRYQGGYYFAGRLTAKARAMLICQSPIRVIEIFAAHRKRDGISYIYLTQIGISNTISTPAPPTIGTLTEVAHALIQKWMKHTGVDYKSLSDDDILNYIIEIVVKFPVSTDDPILNLPFIGSQRRKMFLKIISGKRKPPFPPCILVTQA